MDWKPITRVKGSTEGGRHGRDALLFALSARLSSVPPSEWSDAFNYPGGHFTLGSDEGGLKLSGDTVSVAVEKNQAEDAVKAIDQRIDMANRQYERDVLPNIRAREERKARGAAAEAECLAAVNERLKGL